MKTRFDRSTSCARSLPWSFPIGLCACAPVPMQATANATAIHSDRFRIHFSSVREPKRDGLPLRREGPLRCTARTERSQSFLVGKRAGNTKGRDRSRPFRLDAFGAGNRTRTGDIDLGKVAL